MKYLIAVTILWAFSFSLIGVYLAGQVDAYFAVLLRVALALLLFLPFLRPQPLALALKLIALGAVQLGLMYLFYYQSFLLLSVPEVLVFTIFTPVYITLLYDVLQRRFHYRYLLAAMVAVLAAAAFGATSLWLSLVADVGTSLAVTLHALSLLRFEADVGGGGLGGTLRRAADAVLRLRRGGAQYSGLAQWGDPADGRGDIEAGGVELGAAPLAAAPPLSAAKAAVPVCGGGACCGNGAAAAVACGDAAGACSGGACSGGACSGGACGAAGSGGTGQHHKPQQPAVYVLE